jgi:hypothetical protein
MEKRAETARVLSGANRSGNDISIVSGQGKGKSSESGSVDMIAA